jgi:transmembrane sensor
VDYSGEQRLITLLKGQALFEVAKDPARPFIVTAGAQRVVALGTTFDVRLNDKAVEVILVEGKVEIKEIPASAKNKPARPVQLASGERLVASPAALKPEVTKIDTSKATSWREGYVTFEDTPLTDAIAEMNRYSTVRIVPEDEKLSSLRITGLFRAGQQARFTEALQVYFPIDAKREGNVIVLKMSQPL